MLFNTKFFLFTAVIMIFVMLHLQVVSQVQASDPAPPPAKTVNGTTVAPTLTGNGILVAVLIGLFIIGVPSGLIDFIPMIFMFILITFFAGVLSEKEIGYGFSNAGLISVAFLGIILDPIGRLPLVRRFSFWAFSGEKGGRTWQLTKILLGQAVFSLALPNAPHAQLFTPILRDVAVASGMHPKYVLMPMSVLLSASNFILVASASNIITSGVLRDAGYGELGMGDVFISNIVPTIATILMCLLMSNLLYPSDIDEEEAADYKDDKKTNDGFMSQTKFRGLFEVFPEHLTQDVKKYNLVGRKVSEVLEFLPEALRNKIELVRIKTRTDKPPASIVASSTTAQNNNNNNNEPAADAEGPSINNSTTTTMRNRGNAGSNLPSPYANDIDGTANINLFTVINEKQACLDHVIDENDRLIVEGTVADLRSFRTLLSLAWVGLSDSTFHNGVDVLSPRHSLHDGENEEEDSDHGEQQKQQEGTEMAEQNGNNNNTTADDNSLYKLRIENDGLHAFLPVDRAEMKKIRFAIVVISHFNAAIGRRLGDRFFVDQFRVSVVSLRTQTGDLLVGRELVYHALEAGDTLLLRLRPKATPIFANAANLQSNFYDVEGLEGLNPTDQMIKKHYVIVPTLFSKCVPWGEQVTTSGGATQHVIRLPEWWQNITLLIFVAIIAIAASGQSLTAVSGVGVAFYVVLGFMTPAETIKAVDWKLIVGIALSFGLGSAMTNSGLGNFIGYHIAHSGAEGFPMVLLACFIVGAFTLVVGNKGSIQLLWPVLLPMVQSLHQPPKVAAIIIAQMCVAGFATVTGCPSHMVIAGPGNFSGPDFFKYGLPIMIVYTLLTAVFICIEFDIAF